MFRITTVPRTAAVALTMAAVMLSSSNASAQAPDPNLARNLAASCANCHGTNGNSVGGMAGLAGADGDSKAGTAKGGCGAQARGPGREAPPRWNRPLR